MTFDPAEMVGQFILSRDQNMLPAGWQRFSHDGWHLGAHADLPVVECLAADGTLRAWLLGHPISPRAEMVHQAQRLPAGPGGDDFESFLYEYAGRFAAVDLAHDAPRLYLDPTGSLAAVFSAQRQMAASTATLVPSDGEGDLDKPLMAAIEADPEYDWYYPLGLTARRDVTRLQPDHYLDLAHWRAVRHWPKATIATPGDSREAVLELAAILRRSIAAIAAEGPFRMSLTGGRDSRMLLASAREHLDRARVFTFRIGNRNNAVDMQIAPRIARRFSLNYEILRLLPADEEEVVRYHRRTGRAVGGLTVRMAPTYAQLGRGTPLLMGAAGEIGRPNHWRDGDTTDSPVTPGDLLDRRRLPRTPQLLEQADAWLASLPHQDTLAMWGLLYNEQFNGAWFSPLLYGVAHTTKIIFPFSHRRAMEIMIGLDGNYRRQMLFEKDLIGSQWPQLLDYPFNWPMGWPRIVGGIRRRVAALIGNGRARVKS